MLKIVNFTKKYGDKVAVDNLSLHIRKGEIYGFIGHNGAGKTTTLKACCGINQFTEGNIYIDGISIKENALQCKRMISYLPDNPDVYSFMTGIQYLNFISDVFQLSTKERAEKIEKYAGFFGIKDKLGQPVSTYSRGMKQKLVIISAWIHSPKLILMDEPFGGLDPLATYNLKQLMHEHCDNGGAIFYSTHVLDVAEKLCDKVAIIKNGKLIVSGTMEEVKGNTSLEDIFFELEV